MARLVRGLGSLAVLLLGTAGVPLALAFLGGNPLPDELSWSAVRQALFTPVDGVILVGLITIVGWLAWLVFTVSVISELVAVVSRQRIRIRLPGLDAPQRFAAGLLISVITMISVPHAVQADPHSDRQAAVAPRTPEPATLIIEPIEPDCVLPGAGRTPDRGVGDSAPATWCRQVMISGVWPSSTTEMAEIGARSQRRIRRC